MEFRSGNQFNKSLGVSGGLIGSRTMVHSKGLLML